MTAATPSDLETVMQRLAKSVATGKSEVLQDIRTMTQREQMSCDALRQTTTLDSPLAELPIVW